jgi:hypothetical protein
MRTAKAERGLTTITTMTRICSEEQIRVIVVIVVHPRQVLPVSFLDASLVGARTEENADRAGAQGDGEQPVS